jgi:hypothetical protein
MDSGKKGRHVFVTGIYDLLSVKLGFLMLRETGINAESRTGFRGILEPNFAVYALFLSHT